MICPACKYEYHEPYAENHPNKVIGEKGDFFYMSKDKMRRDSYKPFRTVEKLTTCGCPSCGNVFMDVATRAFELIQEQRRDSIKE